MEDNETRIRQIDPARLAEVVSLLLGKKTILMTDWTAKPIHGGLDKNNALIRCQGNVADGGQSLPWSLVIKITCKVPENDDPKEYQYWKREALVYQSDLTWRLPGNLRAPRCLAVEEQSDDSIWIWMEDIRDDHGENWPFETYGQAAYQLGRFNGAFLAGTAMPGEAWLAHNFLRNYVERASPSIAFIRKNPTHKLVRSLYGNNLPLILALWQVRGELLDILERSPQVFCHQDAFKRNLFFQQDKLIAIDWGFCGNAPAGAELVPLVAVALSFKEIPAGTIREFEQLCLDSYQKGLSEAGANISKKSVRRNYMLTILLRYIFGGNIGDILPALLDENRHTWLEQGIGQSLEETANTSQEESNYYLSIFLKSLRLMGIRALLKVISYAIWFSMPGIKKGQPSKQEPE
jgi:hypothetical protein